MNIGEDLKQGSEPMASGQTVGQTEQLNGQQPEPLDSGPATDMDKAPDQTPDIDTQTPDSETDAASTETDKEPTHLASVDHSNNVESDVKPDVQTESNNPIPGVENTIHPEEAAAARTTNIDKAMDMASAEDAETLKASRDDSLSNEINQWNKESAAKKAADNYELQEIAKRQGITPEQLINRIGTNARAFLKYADEITQDQLKYGEKLSPGLEVLQTLNGLVTRYPDLLKYRSIYNGQVRIDVDFRLPQRSAVRITIHHYGSNPDIAEEEWLATPFAATGQVYNGYLVKSYSKSEDEDGFFTETIKHRAMTAEDAAKFSEVFSKNDFSNEAELEKESPAGQPSFSN